MNIVRLALYGILIVYLCFLTYTLATDYQKNETRSRSPFVIWVIDTIDLFIHETGHLVFRIFGRFIYFLGGSLFQIIIPVATVLVFARSTLRSLPFTLYWTGQSIVNVSIYIGDAPSQRLHLISHAAIHDWRWLLNYMGTMEYAEDIAMIVNITGLLTCCVGIGFGLYFIIQDFLRQISPEQYQYP
jgi:hypothetical protein